MWLKDICHLVLAPTFYAQRKAAENLLLHEVGRRPGLSFAVTALVAVRVVCVFVLVPSGTALISSKSAKIHF